MAKRYAPMSFGADDSLMREMSPGIPNPLMQMGADPAQYLESAMQRTMSPSQRKAWSYLKDIEGQQDQVLVSPREERQWIANLGSNTLGTIEKAANVLDVSSSIMRDSLWNLSQFAKPVDPADIGSKMVNPIDQVYSEKHGLGAVFRPENRRQHRDTIRHLLPGMISKEDTWTNFIFGELPADIAFDPLTYVSFGGSGILKYGGKILSRAGVLSKVMAKAGGKRAGLRAGKFLDAYKPYKPKSGKYISANRAKELVDERTLMQGELLGKHKSPKDAAYLAELKKVDDDLALKYGVDSASEVAERADEIADARAIEEALGWKHNDELADSFDEKYLKDLADFQDDIVKRATEGDLSGSLGGIFGIHGGPFSSTGYIIDDAVDAIVPGSMLKAAKTGDAIGRWVTQNAAARFIKQHTYAPAMGLLKTGAQALAEKVYPAVGKAKAFANAVAAGSGPDSLSNSLQEAIGITEGILGPAIEAQAKKGYAFDHLSGPERKRVFESLKSGVGDTSAKLQIALMDGRAKVWAQAKQRPVDDFYSEIEIRFPGKAPAVSGLPDDELFQVYRHGKLDDTYRPRVREYVQNTLNPSDKLDYASWQKRLKKASIPLEEAEELGLGAEFWEKVGDGKVGKEDLLNTILDNEVDLDVSHRRGAYSEYSDFVVPYGTNYTETIFNVNVGKQARNIISDLERQLADVEQEIVDAEAVRKFGSRAESLTKAEREKVADDILFEPQEAIESEIAAPVTAEGKYIGADGQPIPKYVLEYEAETYLGKALDDLSEEEIAKLIRQMDKRMSSLASSSVDEGLDYDDYHEGVDYDDYFLDDPATRQYEEYAEEAVPSAPQGPSLSLLSKRSRLIQQIDAQKDLLFDDRYRDTSHFTSDPAAFHSRTVAVSDPEGKSTLVMAELQSDHQQRFRKQQQLHKELQQAAQEGKDADSVLSLDKYRQLESNLLDLYLNKGVPEPEYKGNVVRLGIMEQIQRAIDEGHDYIGLAEGHDIALSVHNPMGTEAYKGLVHLYDKKVAKQFERIFKKLDPDVKPESLKAGFSQEIGSHVSKKYDTDINISLLEPGSPEYAKAIGAIAEKEMYSGGYTRYRLTDKAKEAFASQTKPLYQTARGEVLGSFKMSDGKKVISIFEGGNFNTLVHETGHLFRASLSEVEDGLLRAVDSHYGIKDGNWTRAAEERFAKDFQAYVKEGKFENPQIKTVFERFKAWLLGVYQTFIGDTGGRQVSDEIREVFNKMLGDDANPYIRKGTDNLTAGAVTGDILQHVSERAGKVGFKGAWDEATGRLLPENVTKEQSEKLYNELGPIIEKMHGKMHNANRLAANEIQIKGGLLQDLESDILEHSPRRGASKSEYVQGAAALAPTSGAATAARSDEIRDIPELILEEMRLDPEAYKIRNTGSAEELAEYLLDNYGDFLSPSYKQGTEEVRSDLFGKWVKRNHGRPGFTKKLKSMLSMLDENKRALVDQVESLLADQEALELPSEIVDQLNKELPLQNKANHALNLAKYLKRHVANKKIHSRDRLDTFIRYQTSAKRLSLVYDGIHSHVAENLVSPVAGRKSTTPLEMTDLKTVYSRAGMDPSSSIAYLSQLIGKNTSELEKLYVPNEIADSITSVIQAHRPGEFQHTILNAIDTFNNLFKSSVTVATAGGVPLFPSFFARNYTSGQFMNLASGLIRMFEIPQYLSAYRKALAIRSQPESKYISEALIQEVIGHGKGLDDAEGLIGAIPPSMMEYASSVATRKGPAMDAANKLAEAMHANPSAGADYFISGTGKAGAALHKKAVKQTAYGGVLNSIVEYHNRMPMYVYLREKGFSPEAAAQEVKKLQFDYSELAPTEREFFKRIIPFYTFTRKASELFARQLAAQPGGALSKTITLSNRASENDAFTPQYISEKHSIRLDKLNPFGADLFRPEDKTQRTYLTGFGLPHEDTLALVGSPAAGIVGRTSPLLQYGIETALGRDTFRNQPLEEIRSSGVNRIIKNITGAEDAVDIVPQRVEHALRRSPFSRMITSVRQITDPDKALTTKALGQLTGLKISEVRRPEQLRALRTRGEQALRRMGVAKEAQYTPAYLLDTLPSGQREEAERINYLLKQGRRNLLNPFGG